MAESDPFESAWERVQAGEPVRAAVTGAGDEGDLARLLQTAGVMAAFGSSIAVPPVEQGWGSLRPTLETPGNAKVLKLAPRQSPGFSLKRAAVLVAAMLSALSLVAVAWAASPGTPQYPIRLAMEKAVVMVVPHDANVRRDFAGRRLIDLLSVLRSGAVSEASSMATSLMDARSEAVAAGASTSSLDAAIRAEVPGALSGAPSSVARAVRAALGDVLPPGDDGSTEADFSACVELTGLENAICRHEARLKENPDNAGLQKSLAHLQANLAKHQDKTPPGQDKTPPGQDKTPPGQDKTPPGQDKTPPGQDKTPPGQDKTPPGQDKTPPGQDKTPPGQDKTPPGQDKTPKPPKTEKPPKTTD